MDAKYYPKDVKWAKEQEFLKFKQGRTMSVMGYAAKFNKLSCFGPVYIATDDIRMEWFERGLKGTLKEAITSHSYTNFQEMYKKMIKIEATEKEEVQAKRKFGSGSSNTEPRRNPKMFNPRQFQNKRK